MITCHFTIRWESLYLLPGIVRLDNKFLGFGIIDPNGVVCET